MNRAIFEAALRESPNDSTLWLVLADWLEEREQGEYAEAIRAIERLSRAFPKPIAPFGLLFNRLSYVAKQCGVICLEIQEAPRPPTLDRLLIRGETQERMAVGDFVYREPNGMVTTRPLVNAAPLGYVVGLSDIPGCVHVLPSELHVPCTSGSRTSDSER